MRKNIVHRGAESLTYEIRGIIKVANELKDLGINITWENIGDPIQKGEKIPEWIKEIVKQSLEDDSSWGYCATKGIDETREFLKNDVNKRSKAQITSEDIVFFNGLGDAVSKIYGFLNQHARVIGPSPAYPTHSSAEGAHAGDMPLTYELDPKNNWFPNLKDLENKIKFNPNITGILIINPDNPTGMIYPKEHLEKIVEIAKKYNLFIIADEIYANIHYNGENITLLSDIIQNVPGISMKGLSKEVPWPGARCGWIEIYNKDKEPLFSRYIDTINNAKMLEVCSTTLPQMVIPKIISNPKFQEHLEKRNKKFRQRAEYAYNALKDIPGVIVNQTKGAFYMSVIFNEDKLNNNQKLKIENPRVKQKVEELCKSTTDLDRRFIYYLLGASGICVVPMTSFASELHGFRITLLEENEEKFKWIFYTVAQKIKEYLNS